jgi:peptidoglycan biosynthesis protein MviN/MurJ (putative lipid II flippase)
MVQSGSFLKAIGRATLGNALGRSANVLIPLAVVSVCGVDRFTDQFFLVMAVAFFFYGTTANAVAETTVPLLLSGKLSLSRGVVAKIAFGAASLVLLCALGWRILFGQWPLLYAAALALMSGAGLLNGLATGVRHAQEAYLLPGLLWLVRLLPLAVFMVMDATSPRLVWLALGLGLADWIRGLILIHGPVFTARKINLKDSPPLRTSIRTYVTVLAASIIMGLNPIVDRIIAQHIGSGALSILETGERFYSILGGLATMGLMTVILTRLSRAPHMDKFRRKESSMTKSLIGWSSCWLLLGAGAGLWGLDLWLSGATPLSPSRSASVKAVYWYYLMGLPVFILGMTYVKRLQARTHFQVLVFTSILAVGLNIPISLFLAGRMGVPGIALATTLIYAVNSLVLIGFERRSRPKTASDRGLPPATDV